MTALASGRRGLGRLDLLLCAAVLTASWHKLAWAPLGRVSLADLLQVAFVAALVGDRVRRRDRRLSPVAVVVAAFGIAFLAVYLAGFGDLQTDQAVGQWSKGIITWAIHYGFLVAACAHVPRRGAHTYAATLVAFIAGFVLNAAYGVIQFVAQVGAHVNTDELVISPFFSGAATSGANLYGYVSSVDANGALQKGTIYRLTALTNDPNHLGVMIAMPMLILLALSLRVRGGRLARFRGALGALAAGALVVQLLTQSRSGLVGTFAGLVVLGLGLRRDVSSRALVVPLVVLGLAVGGVLYAERGYVESVVKSRLQTSSRGSNIHEQVYQLVGPVLEQHPALGLGLNNFALYYAFQTGRSDFGPHSFYVSTLTETGLVGGLLELGFLVWVGGRLRRAIALGRAREDEDGGVLAALGFGLTAAVVATLAGNLFYLTMIFESWYVLVLFAVTAVPALAPELAGATAAAARRRPGAALAAASVR